MDLPLSFVYHTSWIATFLFGGWSFLITTFGMLVIVTQSKQLGTFKYFLLNQTFWAMLFELANVLFRPVIMTPYLAMYLTGGLHKLVNYQTSIALTSIWAMLYVNAQLGTIISLMNRFLFVFGPKISIFIKNKYTVFSFIVFHIFLHLGVAYYMYTITETPELTRQHAHIDSEGTLDLFFNETSFFYCGQSNAMWKSWFFLDVVITSSLLSSIIYFIITVFIYKKKTIIVSKTSTSLLVSSLSQAFLNAIFFMMPALCALGAMGLQINGSALTVNIVLELFHFHCTADMICMLYCIVPYRKFCISLFHKVVKIENPRTSTVWHAVSMRANEHRSLNKF
uniref:Serpentine Receptor, class T n=1 Tax=Panagrellus redivivus TaxID=6233 RepID=A0A7E4VW57_PANRE